MATEPNFDRLLDPFDQSLIENKQGKSYIGHEHIRLRVIEATGNQFDWEVTSVDYRMDGAVKDRPLKVDGKLTGEMFTPQVMIVTGKLSIPGLGVRTGMGVQVLESGAGEDSYKAAESDAFKRAAMAFGVALEQLYVNGGKPSPVSSHRATSRPQALQHQPEQAQNAMPDDVFGAEVRTAITSKDGELLRSLVDQAGDHPGRWIALVKATDTPEALGWMVKQIERRGVASDLLLSEIHKAGKRLGAVPNLNMRSARRENALPNLAPDDVEAGRAAAERALR